jgi:hypothetical protein
MFEAQGRRCAVFGCTDPGSKRGWHTDHDHVTKKVRGIVCQRCNLMLGGARDSRGVLAAGIRYLEVHGC